MNRPPALTLASILAATLAACSGSSGPAIPNEAVIALDLELPDGGAIQLADPPGINTVQTETLQILNQGRATLTVTSVKLTLVDGGTPGANFAFSQPLVAVDAGTVADPLPVKIGGIGTGVLASGFLQFNYSPKAAGRTNAILSIDSDAPARPHIGAPITACAGRLADGGC